MAIRLHGRHAQVRGGGGVGWMVLASAAASQGMDACAWHVKSSIVGFRRGGCVEVSSPCTCKTLCERPSGMSCICARRLANRHGSVGLTRRWDAQESRLDGRTCRRCPCQPPAQPPAQPPPALLEIFGTDATWCFGVGALVLGVTCNRFLPPSCNRLQQPASDLVGKGDRPPPLLRVI